MEIPYGLFYFYTFFFAVIAVVAFVRAYREKNRIFYVSGGLCLLGAGWSLLFVLNQVLLGGLFWVIAMIISIAMLPALNKFEVDRMREVDIASPLRAADFFSNTNSGWLKLAYKRGLGTSVVLYTLQFTVVSVMMLLGLNLFYSSLSGFILPAVIGGAIFIVIRFYIQIKRALTSIRLSSGSSPSPSMPQNRPHRRPRGP